MGGHRKIILDPHRGFIIEAIQQTPHLTLHGLKDLPGERDIFVSHNAVWAFLRREGLSFKKTLFGLEQARVDVVRKRRRWQSFMEQLNPKHLVFIGETWIKTRMAPLRGWGKRGKHLHGFAPHGRWNTMTFIAALRYDDQLKLSLG